DLGWLFYDADDFHPSNNITKMQSGIPLSDADREPWLRDLEKLIRESAEKRLPIVLACSALKAIYRARLKAAAGQEAWQFIYLRISPSVALERLKQRVRHFMSSALVPSQFETLEEPNEAVVVDGVLAPEEIVSEIRRELGI
ncbi:MAG: gluconokinase, partial [Pyrinomonadaceae bacterium]